MGPVTSSAARSNLALRVASIIAFAPLAIAAAWLGGPFFLALITAAVIVAAFEWARLCGLKPGFVRTALILLSPLVALLAGLRGVDTAALALVAALVIVAAGGRLTRADGTAWAAGGIAYLGLPAIAILYLRDASDAGRWAVLWLFAVVSVADIGAYATGRLIGGPKLAPTVSPRKTWAGFVGGVVLAVVAGVFFIAAAFAPTSLWLAAGIAGALAVVAHFGDLFESAVKRRFGAKDSGAIIPGHGGVLDRIDSLLFTAPVLAMVVAFGGWSLFQT